MSAPELTGRCRTRVNDGPWCGLDAAVHAIQFTPCLLHKPGHVRDSLAFCPEHYAVVRSRLLALGYQCHPFGSACELPGAAFVPAATPGRVECVSECVLLGNDHATLTVASILAAESHDD